MLKECVVCGREFQAVLSTAKYCSPKCKHKAHNEKKREARIERGEGKARPTCLICGKPLVGKGRRCYCSDACRDTAKKRQMAEINAARREDYQTLKQAKKAKREAAARAKLEAQGRLDAKLREATRLHISYGQLQVLKAREAAKKAREAGR